MWKTTTWKQHKLFCEKDKLETHVWFRVTALIYQCTQLKSLTHIKQLIQPTASKSNSIRKSLLLQVIINKFCCFLHTQLDQDNNWYAETHARNTAVGFSFLDLWVHSSVFHLFHLSSYSNKTYRKQMHCGGVLLLILIFHTRTQTCFIPVV